MSVNRSPAARDFADAERRLILVAGLYPRCLGVRHGSGVARQFRLRAASGVLVEEAGEIVDVEDGCDRRAVAVRIGIAGGVLVNKAREVVDIEDRREG